jgi:glycosyltransferase involved in cell wall biosynthesis
MKILHVCPRYRPFIGGVEEHVGNICERLVEEHDVEVYTTDPSGTLPACETIGGVKVSRFPSWAPNEAYFFSYKLKKKLSLASSDFDIVHAHNYASFPALYAAQAKGKNKLVFTPHYHSSGHTFFRSLLHRPYKFFGKRIFEKADLVICVSNFERTSVTNSFKIREEDILVIPNGVNLDEFRSLKRGNKNFTAILYVGRLEKYKGVQYLIRVLPQLDQGTVLEIVGKGPYKADLVELANKLKVKRRVRFFQDLTRKELLEKYMNSDLFILLSKHEAYGISVAEALCAGTPCIVANTSALSEWIDNKNCFGIEYPINIGELASLIKVVAGRKVEKIGISDWDDVVETLTRAYEDCC